MMDNSKQLNPFEIKAELNSLYIKLKGIQDFENYPVHFRILDAQEDKNIIVKLLFKELANAKENATLIKFLLLRYADKKELITKLWDLIRNPMSANLSKIIALDILRDIDTDWSYENCESYLDNPDELIDEDTKRLLTTAIINPEVQIDFLDFLNSLGEDDKITLVNSLADDYSGEELANILIPVFLSQPETNAGKKALELLSNSRSQLAYHALLTADTIVPYSSSLKIKKAISTLKLSGIREDNSEEFYKKLLNNSKPYKFYTTDPDGGGNQALIFSRIKPEGKVQFVAIVINDYCGIRDCFGFNEISKFECDTIISRFYKAENAISIEPLEMKRLLEYGEKIAKESNNTRIPYEYVCWRNLLADIQPDNKTIKEILDEKFQAKPLSKSEFDKISQFEFMDYWFLDEGYSDEFELFLQNLNTKLSLNVDFDIDKMISEEVDNIFYPEERTIWINRILMCAYLSLISNNVTATEFLYSLYNSDEYKTELLKLILRKSIYEYYVNLKETGNGLFSKNVIEDIVNNIEKKWVQNV